MKTDFRKWAAAVLLFFPFWEEARAEVVWEKTEVSFLPAFGEKKLSSTLPFKNTGEKPMRIAKIASSCGCTAGTADKQEYQPGETGVLTVNVDMEKFLYQSTRIYHVAVTWEDKTVSIVSVKIKSPGTLKFFPTAVFWRKGEPLSPKEIRVDLEARGPAETLTVSSSDPVFSVELVPVVKGQAYRMIVTPNNSAPKIGTFNVEAKFSGGQITRGSATGRITP
jgi:hypothetical protein